MTEPSPDLTPEQLLAAYADGELDAAGRGRAEELLRLQPQFAADWQTQAALSPRNARFWNTVEPPLPSDARWNTVRSEIDRRLDPAPEPNRRPSRYKWLKRGLMLAALAVTGSAAAAVIVANLPGRSLHVPSIPSPPMSSFDEGDEVLAMTRPDDVDIVSIRHADSPQLVVGVAPLPESLTLASADDVNLENLEPAENGTLPRAQWGGTEVPAIMAPSRAP